jgi:hypothetical protein
MLQKFDVNITCQTLNPGTFCMWLKEVTIKTRNIASPYIKAEVQYIELNT